VVAERVRLGRGGSRPSPAVARTLGGSIRRLASDRRYNGTVVGTGG
jgi:hypothetical protein